MTANTIAVIVGTLAMPLSGIVGAYFTYRALSKSTKETTVTNLLNAAHGASKDLIAQLSAELTRLREQMNTNEEHYGAELGRMAIELKMSNGKIGKLTQDSLSSLLVARGLHAAPSAPSNR